MEMKLKQLREQANAAPSLYEKTCLDYAYMNLVWKEADDVQPYRHEIEAFQQLCLIYMTVYEDALYGRFQELLQKLETKLH